MFCTECGKENKDESLFCEWCGTKLVRVDDTPQAEPVVEEQKAETEVVMPDVEQIIEEAIQEPVAEEPAIEQMITAIEEPKVEPPVVAPKVEQAAPVVKKEKKAGNPNIGYMVALIAEIVISVVLVVMLVSNMGKMYGPGRTAANFFASVVNGSYDEAYALLDVDDNPFLSKELFANSCKYQNFEEMEIYEVTKENANRGDVTIEYEYDGDDAKIKFDMNKDGKKFLFFDEWLVDISDMVTEFTVEVPNGASVTVDGILLDDSYLESDDDNGWDRYVIEELFKGKHNIVVEQDARQPYSADYVVMDEDYFSCYLNYSKEAIEEMQKQAMDNLIAVYDAAVAQEDFSAIESLFTEEAKDMAREEYTYLRDNMTNIVDVAIRDVTVYGTTGDVYCDVSFTYEAAYTSYNWFSGAETIETYEAGQSTSFTFERVDGVWKQMNFDFYYL